jgi:hypothetical protein
MKWDSTNTSNYIKIYFVLDNDANTYLKIVFIGEISSYQFRLTESLLPFNCK